jgi:hypothetical protein
MAEAPATPLKPKSARLTIERFPADEESGYGVMEALNVTGYAGAYNIEAQDLGGDTYRLRTMDEQNALTVIAVLMEMFSETKPLSWLRERLNAAAGMPPAA